MDQRRLDEFAAWMARQRWFGDKSRQLVSIEPSVLASVPVEDATAILVTVDCRFTDGGHSSYFVPLMNRLGPEPEDALEDPSFRAWLAAGFRNDRSIDAESRAGGRIAWERPERADDTDWSDLDARVLGGEQSNTSVLFGTEAILKVFRKIQPGVNPDSEIVAALTAETGYAHVPSFLGGIVLRPGDGQQQVELAAVQRFVPNEGDCWRWLPGALATSHAAALERLLDPIALLGQRTGELHVALASIGSLESFRPESYDPALLAAERERLVAEVRHTVAMLPPSAATDVAGLEQTLLRRVADLAVLDGLSRIRVHGDYHLGQVLRAGDDFVIIDFEGEPSRPMAERRQKQSPLKDVAGMLRSLDYAVSSVLREGESRDTEALYRWARDAETRFLDAYQQAVRRSGVPLVPEDAVAFVQALDVFMIEKALYEVRYELDNRPDWLDIPLGALARIAARANDG